MWLAHNIIHAPCSRLGFIHWLQGHLLPCPFKYLTGIDCPGCGFQRSVMALIQGDLQKSFLLYPAAIPLVLFFLYGIADRLFKLDNENHVIKKTVFLINGNIVLISYCVKMWHVYHYGTYVY